MADAVGHCGRFLLDSFWWPWIHHSRDVSAETGARLTTTAELFRDMAGFRTVIENEAVLIHHEGLSRLPGTNLTERLEFFRLWGNLLEHTDPFFTPHLKMDR